MISGSDVSTSPLIELNPALDAKQLAELYAERQRLQVRDFFREPVAEAVLRGLQTEIPWGVAFNDGPNVTQIPAEQAARLTPEQQQQILQTIYARAQKGYQFFYNFYPVSTAYFGPGCASPTLAHLFELINTPAFLGLIRTITGLEAIRWADAHATLYRAGHFLKYHTDENAAEHRLAAYVLNFTKGWGRDWGGFLHFYNERYDIEEGLRPLFNALNIFTVPADHSVSMVASYAPGSRFSVTGWFRGDKPPGPIATPPGPLG